MTGNFLYVNTLVVAGVCLLGFIISTAIVNFIGKKPYLSIQRPRTLIQIPDLFLFQSVYQSALAYLSRVCICQQVQELH